RPSCRVSTAGRDELEEGEVPATATEILNEPGDRVGSFNAAVSGRGSRGSAGWWLPAARIAARDRSPSRPRSANGGGLRQSRGRAPAPPAGHGRPKHGGRARRALAAGY